MMTKEHTYTKNCEGDSMREEFNRTDLIYNNPLTVNRYFINIDTTVDSADNYREIYKQLILGETSDYFIFMLNTCGGDSYTAQEMSSSMLRTAGNTRAVVINAHSAGSIIAFSCDEIIIEDGGSIMIHAPALYGAGGKPQSIETISRHFSKSSKDWYSKLYQGFMTKEEIDQVFLGADFWFDDKEAKKRLKKWIPIRKRGNK